MSVMGKGAARGRLVVRWLAATVVLAAGVFLIYLPFHRAAQLDRYANHLRTSGEPVQATLDEDVEIFHDVKPKKITTRKLVYEFHDTRHEEAFNCAGPCPVKGTKVRIWVNPNDPLDYVDEYGTLSGDRNRLSAVLGLAGVGAIFLAGMILLWPLRERDPDPADQADAEPEPVE
jgi:hypothetical protein